MKGLSKRFYFNDYNAGFHPQTPKLESRFKTTPSTLGVTGIRKVGTCIPALRLDLQISLVSSTVVDLRKRPGGWVVGRGGGGGWFPSPLWANNLKPAGRKIFSAPHLIEASLRLRLFCMLKYMHQYKQKR